MNRWSLTVSETVWNHAKVIFEVRCFMITGNFDSLWTRDKKCPICMSHINNQVNCFDVRSLVALFLRAFITSCPAIVKIFFKDLKNEN